MKEQQNHYATGSGPSVRQSKKNRPLLRGKILLTGVLVIVVAGLYLASRRLPVVQRSDDRPQGIIDSKNAVEVEVIDTRGNQKQAEYIIDVLRKNGFDVVEYHRIAGRPVDYSYVVDHGGGRGVSQKLAECIGIQKTKLYAKRDTALMVDISLVLGNDIGTLKPYQSH
jgi:hypothetical protein